MGQVRLGVPAPRGRGGRGINPIPEWGPSKQASVTVTVTVPSLSPGPRSPSLAARTSSFFLKISESGHGRELEPEARAVPLRGPANLNLNFEYITRT